MRPNVPVKSAAEVYRPEVGGESADFANSAVREISAWDGGPDNAGASCWRISSVVPKELDG